MKFACVWVVEMWNDAPRRDRWEPTVGTGLTRDDARCELRGFRRNNPNDRFRLRRYVRVEIRELKPKPRRKR